MRSFCPPNVIQLEDFDGLIVKFKTITEALRKLSRYTGIKVKARRPSLKKKKGPYHHDNASPHKSAIFIAKSAELYELS